ncbi:MAG: SIS domain-containing protein [Chitinispirillaceae bacterium]|nr:SIS domain-containing protein [Chitinispirillaceae bacterium]
MDIYQFTDNIFKEHETTLKSIVKNEKILKQLEQTAELLLNAFEEGKRVLLCGNGGSAADAQHIASELVGRFFLDRKPLDAEALTVNTSSLTSISNDYSFDNVFARQVEAKGKKGDILIGITTSGTSKNILAAFRIAKELGLKNVCFTGEKAPQLLEELCEVVIRIPSSSTPRIQEFHIVLGHILCEFIEKKINRIF